MSKIPKPLREIHSVGPDTRQWLLYPASLPALRENGLLLTGWSEARQGLRFHRSRPAFAQVLACCGGQGRVWVEGEWRVCAPGTVYVTPANKPHAYYAEGKGAWDIAWAMLAAPFMPLPAPALLPADTSGFLRILQGLHAEAHAAADSESVALWARLLRRFVERLLSLEGDAAGDARLARAYALAGEDLAAPWTVEKLAQAAEMSAEQLRRLTQRLYGGSPMARVTALRMRYAAALLTSGGATVTEASERVGYNSPFAFSTAFKRFHGAPPSSLMPKT